jgi:hypothetical protein
MKAISVLGLLISYIIIVAAQECGNDEASASKASVAYGIVASAKKFVKRGENVRGWWTKDTLGAGTHPGTWVFDVPHMASLLMGRGLCCSVHRHSHA